MYVLKEKIIFLLTSVYGGDDVLEEEAEPDEHDNEAEDSKQDRAAAS